MSAIVQLRHQSATVPSHVTRAADVVTAHQCHQLWSWLTHVAMWDQITINSVYRQSAFIKVSRYVQVVTSCYNPSRFSRVMITEWCTATLLQIQCRLFTTGGIAVYRLEVRQLVQQNLGAQALSCEYFFYKMIRLEHYVINAKLTFALCGQQFQKLAADNRRRR